MTKIEILKEKKRELLEKIELAEKHKSDVINFVQKLLARYHIGEVSYQEYHEIIEKKFGEKKPQEWVDYYDNYILSCKEQIKTYDKQIRIKKSPFIIIPAIFVLFLLIFFITGFSPMKSVITGLTVQEEGAEISQEAEEPIEEAVPEPKEIGEVEEIKEDKIKEIEEDKTEETEKEKEKPGEPIEESNKTEQENKTEETPKNETQEIPENKKQGVIQELEETKEPANSTEEIIKIPESMGPETKVTGTPILKKDFSDIEIEKNGQTEINLEEHFLGAEQFFLLQARNITSTIFDNTIKIIPDQEFLGTRSVKIIASNSFGTTESNYFNITISESTNLPILIKGIPDIEIAENSETTIHLEEYFSNAEQFFILQARNLSTTTFDHTIKIQPDPGFIGTRESKIIASNQYGIAESNSFKINVIGLGSLEENITEILNVSNISIVTIQYKAVINKPVKWVKKVELDDISQDIKLELPKDAENISIKTGQEIQEALDEIEEYEEILEKIDRGELSAGALTGNVVLDIRARRGFISKIFELFKRVTITGNVILEEQLEEEIIELPESKIIDIGEIARETQEKQIAVEYYTPGPISQEETTSRGKNVIISGENITDILAYTQIPEIIGVNQESRIRIYWREQDSFINFTSADTDANGMLDYIEWLVPHLSEQTFDIILVTKAEHLDENKQFISDIYEPVKALDGNWSEEIKNQEYVRVVFEQNLTKDRDITLYPRTITGNPRIEVYDQDFLIAEFASLTDNEYNKVLLTNLIGEQDSFDLRVVGGSIEIEHIIDPYPQQQFFEDCADITDWTIGGGTTNWALGTGGDAGWCKGSNVDSNTNMTSAKIDLSLSNSANLTFDRSTVGLDAGEYIKIWVNSSTQAFKLIDTFTDNAATSPEYNLASFITLPSGAVHLLFECKNDAGNEKCLIDNINVTTPETIPPGVTINFPTNTTYNKTALPLNFNVTLSENGSVIYSLDNGVNNVTMLYSADQTSKIGLVFNSSNGSIADGTYPFNVYANDTLGNNNFTHFTSFKIDATTPLISFASTTENDFANITDTSINVTISVTETNRDTTKFYLYNGTGGILNISNFTSAINNLNFTGLSVGNYTYNVSINDTAGNINSTGIRHINLTAPPNSAPTITFVSMNHTAEFAPVEDSVRIININFTVSDSNGAGDIDNKSAQITFNLTGETIRKNVTCVPFTSINEANSLNFSCFIDMWYFDGPGAWQVNVTINDSSNALGVNITTNFTYSQLTAMKIYPNALSWPANIALTAENTLSNNDPIRVNNTGNDNTNNIQVTGANLHGETTSLHFIPAANFTVDETNACDAGPAMVNASAVTITGASLTKGNNSVNDGTTGQEDIYFCLEGLNLSVSSQSYSTALGQSWTISIASILGMLLRYSGVIFALAVIIRKKRKKLVKAREITEENILKILEEKIKEKYDINLKELLTSEKSETEEAIQVPISIFKQNIGAAEALSKYLRENKGMKFSEIAIVLNRDQRTIALNYKNAIRKKKENMVIDKESLLMPVELLADRKMSILESVVYHLKKHGFKNSEIAKLLGKDPRNTYTLYSRAVRKLKFKKNNV